MSLEAAFVIPILLVFLMAMTEFAMVLLAFQQLQMGCRNACRMAGMPGYADDPDSVSEDVKRWLTDPGLAAAVQVDHFVMGEQEGDPVVLEISVPMLAASPDLLRVFGVTLEGRRLHARAVMPREEQPSTEQDSPEAVELNAELSPDDLRR